MSIDFYKNILPRNFTKQDILCFWSIYLAYFPFFSSILLSNTKVEAIV